MSTPNGAGSGGRRRAAGLALVALAIIAVLIGVVAVTCRPQSLETGPAPAAPPGSAAPSTIPYPPPSTPPPSPPGPAPSSPLGGKGEEEGEKGGSSAQVRVYNNSTIRGLAARAAGDLRGAGWVVSDVGNYPCGTIPTTTVYYQEGTGQRGIAEAIGAMFGMRVLPRFPGIVNASPGLIVIVTRDYRR